MIKRTIEISSGPTRLSLKNAQLIIDRKDQPLVSAPCEDIGLLIIDHPAVVYTHSLFSHLLDNKVAVVICGKDHLPQGLLLPFAPNLTHAECLRSQIQAGLPLKKRLWQQIVRAKIAHQAANVAHYPKTCRKLEALSSIVRSGDPTNIEAQAARAYWPVLFDKDFRRRYDGPPPNNLLNYGYAVLRAAVARAICGSGLHPALGLHHHNRYDPYCLADDLAEPFRPMIDARVRRLQRDGYLHLNRDAKASLLKFLTDPVICGDSKGPLKVGLSRLTASLSRCLDGKQKALEIPIPCSSVDIE